MSRQTNPHLSIDEYLDLERKAEFKSEYINGEIVAMTGASREHNLITTNLTRELSNALRAKPCEVYSSDMRVRIPSTKLYAYPDVVVACGSPVFEDEFVDTLLNPTLIIEVLSKSTASYDRIQKFGCYRTIESLKEYLLVAQDEYKVEQYVRQADGRWLLSDIASIENIIELTSVDCMLSMREIYDRVILT